ncbi:Regulator of Vps4 activity in the MVB pathway protein [Trifolium repens]|nr:Regulator of Vps4 activity in the MVB pathway protein [Trifolium repens]
MLDELPALDKLVSQFCVKYGEEFVANATMCKADCGVMEQMPEWLLVVNPPVEERNKLLKEIANKFKINWNF